MSPVTLAPIISPEHKELAGYEIRGGPSHHIYGDPYEDSGVLAMDGEVRALSGARPRCKELAQAAADVGLKIWWRRVKSAGEYTIKERAR